MWELHVCSNDCTLVASGLPKRTARGSGAVMPTAWKLQFCNYRAVPMHPFPEIGLLGTVLTLLNTQVFKLRWTNVTILWKIIILGLVPL